MTKTSEVKKKAKAKAFPHRRAVEQAFLPVHTGQRAKPGVATGMSDLL